MDITHISMMYIFRDLALSNPGKSTKVHIYNDKKGKSNILDLLAFVIVFLDLRCVTRGQSGKGKGDKGEGGASGKGEMGARVGSVGGWVGGGVKVARWRS